MSEAWETLAEHLIETRAKFLKGAKHCEDVAAKHPPADEADRIELAMERGYRDGYLEAIRDLGKELRKIMDEEQKARDKHANELEAALNRSCRALVEMEEEIAEEEKNAERAKESA